MGLGLLLFGLMAGGSAIKCGVENAKMMSKPYRYMDDGTPVYLDRLGNEHINGEKVTSKYNYQKGCMQDVGERSGRVYYDEQDVQRKRFEDWNEKERQDAIKKGRLIYKKYDVNRKKNFSCELSTGKYIAYIEGRDDGTYWKYYVSPYRKFEHYEENTKLFKEDSDNNPVEISIEEFDELRIYGGSYFYCSDLTRDKYGNFYPIGYHEKQRKLQEESKRKAKERRDRELAERKKEIERRKQEIEKSRVERSAEDTRLHQMYGNVDN